MLVALLVGAAMWNVSWMLRQRDNARQIRGDLAACEDEATGIEALRGKPKLAATESLGVQQLGERIEAASREAGLAPAMLEGVFPQTAQRLADSPYLQKPTMLTFRGVALPQLAGFLYHLNDRATKLAVRDLRLRSPRGESDGSAWDADVTVTYLIYAPPPKTRDER
jgi:hypothetical protein